MNSVMSNPHFGGILLKKGNIELLVPPEWINTDGRLKSFAERRWKDMLEAEEEKLNKKVV